MIPRVARLALLLFGCVAVGALGGCGGGGTTSSASGVSTGGGGSTPGVALSASATKSSFRRNEPVALRVTLANHGGQSYSVSTFTMGTLHVVSLAHDGKSVSPSHSVVETIEDLGAVVHGSLRTLAPGQSLPLSWESRFNQGAGGQALYSVTVEPHQNPVDLYSLASPGHYVLTLDYSYPASATAEPSTFQGTTNTATASFDVVP
jgi:hypothetical protein